MKCSGLGNRRHTSFCGVQAEANQDWVLLTWWQKDKSKKAKEQQHQHAYQEQLQQAHQQLTRQCEYLEQERNQLAEKQRELQQEVQQQADRNKLLQQENKSLIHQHKLAEQRAEQRAVDIQDCAQQQLAMLREQAPSCQVHFFRDFWQSLLLPPCSFAGTSPCYYAVCLFAVSSLFQKLLLALYVQHAYDGCGC